jgi:hypothetical protein
MFDVLNGLASLPSIDLGERMLNAVASQAIRHLFTQCESIEVFVRCYPSSKLLLGSIDSFHMSGRGLIIGREFPVEQMSFETDVVAIDFRSVLNGNIRLKQPTDAVATVILSEAGINQAFKSELVRKRLQNISVVALSELAGGQPISFTEVSVQLLPENRVRLFAATDLPNYGKVPICLTATLAVEQRRRICFQNLHFELERMPEAVRVVSHDLTASFAQVLDTMIDLERFELDGVMMQLTRLETQDKKLIFSGCAKISHFPGTFNSHVQRNKQSHEKISTIYQSNMGSDQYLSDKRSLALKHGGEN